ncbi:MAG: tyrosine-type recombinase/integrase [Nitrososphaerales archaeon]
MARRGDCLYLRSKTWWLDFRHNGTRHAVRLGKGVSRTVARELASVKRSQILKGEIGIGRKPKDLLFEKAAEDFLTWVEANKRPKTTFSYRQCLNQLKRTFSGKRLGEIHPFLIEKHKHMRIEERAPVAVNRELAVLKALYNRFIQWKMYEGPNPVREVKFLEEPAGRLRYLEPEEEAKLLGAATEPLRTIILFGIYAGLRIQAEALTLRKHDVNVHRRLLTVQAAYAKSKQTRTVPLNKPLREALKPLIACTPGDYVFAKRDGSPYRSIRTAFDTACKRANLEGVTPHTLRHTFASRLAMSGVDLRTIQELGGWKELEMVQRYSHLSPSHKAEAVEKIAENFTTLFTTPKQVPLASHGVTVGK